MSRLNTLVFWQSTCETTVGYAAAGAGAALTAAPVSWHAVLLGAAAGAALGFTKSLSSLQVQPDNGTDSYNKNVVAKTSCVP